MIKYASIKYSLIGAAILLILTGLFFDFHWLKALGDKFAYDGDCDVCKTFQILNQARFALIFIGCVMIFFAVRHFRTLFEKERQVEAFLIIIIFLLLSFLSISTQIRYLNNDEYEHLHNAWMMQRGIIPYFSIHSTHSPLLEWCILTLMRITGESVIIIQATRLFMFFLSCACLSLTYAITNELFSSRIHALLAIVLLVGNQIWFTNSIEIRPDNIMLFFVLVSFLFIIRYTKTKNYAYLLLALLCFLLAMLGKQNAAIFYFALTVTFVYSFLFAKPKARFHWPFIGMGLLAIIVLSQIPLIKDFLVINIKRHLIPNDIKFWPIHSLTQFLRPTPAVLLFFLVQLLHPMEIARNYGAYKKYLYIVSLVCFLFLFLMNRPHTQEMLVMVLFLSIIGANAFASMIKNMEFRFACLLLVMVTFPAFIFIYDTTFRNTMMSDLETTQTILNMSKPNELVFDAYGKAIFRHSPLEPKYLVYLPQKFSPSRSETLKKSDVKYIIKDQTYFPRLPGEVLDWVSENFIQSKKHPDIFVRIGKSESY